MASITPLEGVRIIRQKLIIWNKRMQRMDFSSPGPMISVWDKRICRAHAQTWKE
jgi:hypothetical protein